MTQPLETLLAEAGWRSIDTAPKDGTRIRLGNERDVSSMKVDGIFQTTGAWDGRSWAVSAFFTVPGGRYGLMSSEPTHWMPLPASPHLQSKGE